MPPCYFKFLLLSLKVHVNMYCVLFSIGSQYRQLVLSTNTSTVSSCSLSNEISQYFLCVYSRIHQLRQSENVLAKTSATCYTISITETSVSKLWGIAEVFQVLFGLVGAITSRCCFSFHRNYLNGYNSAVPYSIN